MSGSQRSTLNIKVGEDPDGWRAESADSCYQTLFGTAGNSDGYILQVRLAKRFSIVTANLWPLPSGHILDQLRKATRDSTKEVRMCLHLRKWLHSDEQENLVRSLWALSLV